MDISSLLSKLTSIDTSKLKPNELAILLKELHAIVEQLKNFTGNSFIKPGTTIINPLASNSPAVVDGTYSPFWITPEVTLETVNASETQLEKQLSSAEVKQVGNDVTITISAPSK